MNANAKKWVAALRSGKYKQGKNYLRQGDNFCCLGVACELAIEAGLPLKVSFDSALKPPIKVKIGIYQTLTDDSKHVHSLPIIVQEWLELNNKEGSFFLESSPHIHCNCLSSLTELNDNGLFFEKIATLIESEPLGLFKKI